jgi:hypothetical protein
LERLYGYLRKLLKSFQQQLILTLNNSNFGNYPGLAILRLCELSIEVVITRTYVQFAQTDEALLMWLEV